MFLQDSHNSETKVMQNNNRKEDNIAINGNTNATLTDVTH